MPPIHLPLRRAACILSRVRSPMISRSNWANESRMLRVKRPSDVVVFSCWVTAHEAHRVAVKSNLKPAGIARDFDRPRRVAYLERAALSQAESRPALAEVHARVRAAIMRSFSDASGFLRAFAVCASLCWRSERLFSAGCWRNSWSFIPASLQRGATDEPFPLECPLTPALNSLAIRLR